MTMIMGQTDSLVCAPKQDQRYVGLCAAETLGYFSLAHCSSKASDLGDFFGGQELLESGDASDVDGMLFVAGVVCPFEIGDDAISFHSIDMIDHRKIGWIGYESESYESVDMYRLDTSVSVEIDVAVSQLIGAGSQNLSVYSSGFQPIADTVKAADTSKIAYLIKITEVFNRNRSPFFGDDGIHEAGGPSGEVGSTIKNPPHAATFGGFAIMAAPSDTYKGRPICRLH
jgi:hypothetical protein